MAADESKPRAALNKENVAIGGGATLVTVAAMSLFQQMLGTPQAIADLKDQLGALDKKLEVFIQLQTSQDLHDENRIIAIEDRAVERSRKATNSALKQLQQMNPELKVMLLE